ncbi:unnamed protein product [Staurois parvus]|uniref:Uncharacterized protein n=1 Tax=Staurois parvus TaxID=386267 RepID=A0ABN9GJR6_9NEOB|nr:unnamed protein product [Staurois parvus]
MDCQYMTQRNLHMDCQYMTHGNLHIDCQYMTQREPPHRLSVHDTTGTSTWIVST